MSKIDLQNIRTKTGLSKTAFLAKIRPALIRHNSRLTLVMLNKLENGENLRQDRMDEVVASIRDTFPEFSETDITTTRKSKRLKISSSHMAMIVFVLISVIICGLYFYLDQKEIVNDALTLVASVAGVLAFVLAIYKVVS